MTFDILGDLTWLAVLLAAVHYFALGALWYNPVLFGDHWTRAIGWDPSGEVQMKPIDYLVPFFAYLVAAIALGMLRWRPARTRRSRDSCSGWSSGSVSL